MTIITISVKPIKKGAMVIKMDNKANPLTPYKKDEAKIFSIKKTT